MTALPAVDFVPTGSAPHRRDWDAAAGRYFAALWQKIRDAAPPELHAALDELSYLQGESCAASEIWAVARHGAQIMETISGIRYQYEECMPKDVPEPIDIEDLVDGIGR